MKKRSHANADLTPFPEVLNISAVKKREQNKNKFMSSILKKNVDNNNNKKKQNCKILY